MMRSIQNFILLLIICACSASCWPIALMIHDTFHVVEKLETSTEVFPEAIQGITYRESIRVLAPAFVAAPWVNLTSGSLPKGLQISVAKDESSGEKNLYNLILEGIPQETGSFSFKVRVDCCMTMGGPSMRSSARFMLRVKAQDETL